jgi:signal transduction histidine kinase
MLILFLYFLYKSQKQLSREQNKIYVSSNLSSERERKKIALELHNDIIPQLSGIKLRMSIIEETNDLIHKDCLPNLEKSINDIRFLSKRISPSHFIDDHFLISLNKNITETGIDKKINIYIDEKNFILLDSNTNLSIYRLLQEVVQNTIKHSRATELKIEVSRIKDVLLIRTSDDGVGYNLRTGLRAEGLGLKLIQNIISELKGEMHKNGDDLKGTKYNFKIPIVSEVS